MADRFLIAPYDQNSGLQTDVRPWLIPDQAFSNLTNAYVFRGRVTKRFGSRWLADSVLASRLRVNIGTVPGTGNFSGFTPGLGIPEVAPAIGQMFSIGSQVFTVNALGNPAAMLISGTATLATYDTTTGAVIIQGVPIGSAVYFYPALPVMGLLTYDISAVNDEFIIGFDTRFAYQYSNGWERLSGEITAGSSVWAGNDSQFFWGTTWSGANAFDRVFFVTNFNELEPLYMRTFFAGNWNTFRPKISNLNLVPVTPVLDIYLDSARIILPFKNRLVVLNTWESESINGIAYTQRHYVNRARYSQIGSPLDPVAWRQDIKGLGSGIDAPTLEAIVSAEFVKDRLIVFFERSTWELVYTGNQIYPFAWQQINTELGAESTFSIVPFDKVAFGIGDVGIHACNGANVERIDAKIPDAVFQIHNVDEGLERVYGIRDYYSELVYWTFPDATAGSDAPFPKRVLVYNYKTGTWAFNYDSITVFGYFQPTTGITWDSTTITWDDDVSWDSGSVQAKFRNVIAGNQEGFTFLIDRDIPTNASVLQITDLTVAANNVVTVTAINHNFNAGDYAYLEGITGTGNLNLLNDAIYQVIPIDPDTFKFATGYLTPVIAGTYTGGGLISITSNVVVETKQYNFYANKGRNAYIQRIDFMMDKTNAGQTQVNFFVSTSIQPLLDDAEINGVLLGTGTLDTFPYTAANGAADPVQFEEFASRVWHPVYFQADGEIVQFKLEMNDAQMRNTAIRKSGFALHAMVIWAQPTSYNLQ